MGSITVRLTWGFSCFAYVELDRDRDLQVWSNANQSNRRSAIQGYFLLHSKWVFSALTFLTEKRWVIKLAATSWSAPLVVLRPHHNAASIVKTSLCTIVAVAKAGVVVGVKSMLKHVAGLAHPWSFFLSFFLSLKMIAKIYSLLEKRSMYQPMWLYQDSKPWILIPQYWGHKMHHSMLI